MLDVEKLIYQLLTRSLPDFQNITPMIDVRSLAMENVPILGYTVIPGSGIDNPAGGQPSAWECTVALTLWSTSDRVRTDASSVYDAVWSWNNPWSGAGIIEDLGHAAEIADSSIFSRTSAASIDGRLQEQWDGVFTMQLHQA